MATIKKSLKLKSFHTINPRSIFSPNKNDPKRLRFNTLNSTPMIKRVVNLIQQVNEETINKRKKGNLYINQIEEEIFCS